MSSRQTRLHARCARLHPLGCPRKAPAAAVPPVIPLCVPAIDTTGELGRWLGTKLAPVEGFYIGLKLLKREFDATAPGHLKKRFVVLRTFKMELLQRNYVINQNGDAKKNLNVHGMRALW
jgi:hypothetical protein